MGIVISDQRVIERLNQLADQLQQTPEEIVAEALEQFSPPATSNTKAFWNAIRGIGESGDPSLAENIKDILKSDVDPIEGWNKPNDDESIDR